MEANLKKKKKSFKQTDLKPKSIQIIIYCLKRAVYIIFHIKTKKKFVFAHIL